jgi:hypothetical protein
LKDVLLTVVSLSLKRKVDISKAGAEIDHGIFWIQGMCAEEIIWKQLERVYILNLNITY